MTIRRRKSRSLLDELFSDKFRLDDEIDALVDLMMAKMHERKEIVASIDKEETVLMEGFPTIKKISHDYFFEAGQTRKPGKPVV